MQPPVQNELSTRRHLLIYTVWNINICGCLSNNIYIYIYIGCVCLSQKKKKKKEDDYPILVVCV